jgi:hypothetical protein
MLGFLATDLSKDRARPNLGRTAESAQSLRGQRRKGSYLRACVANVQLELSIRIHYAGLVLRASGRACVLAFGLIGFCAGSARADELQVEAADAACPDAGQLEQALRPVLEQDVALVFEASPSTTWRARVSDDGAVYAIEIDGERREIEDARRDCEERARVAAVFIALNIQATKSEPAKPVAPDPEAAPEEPEPPPPPPGFGASLQALGEHATDAERTAFGAGASIFYALAPFRFELSAAVLAPIELRLTPRDDVRGRVDLVRIPLALTTSYLVRIGDFELGPLLGLALDVLHMKGQGVERPQTELRLSPGVALGAAAHLWLSPRIGLVFQAQMRAFPRAYRLTVEPAGALGRTPGIWVGAQLGAQARF